MKFVESISRVSFKEQSFYHKKIALFVLWLTTLLISLGKSIHEGIWAQGYKCEIQSVQSL